MFKKKSIAFAALMIALTGVFASFAGSFGFLRASAAPSANNSYNAKAALLLDFDSGEVIYSQNENERLPIASMVKIMTLTLVFEEMEKGVFDINTPVTVSENASGMGGSQAFLDANAQYPAGELMKSIVVASANDSCVAMAEFVAGSVEEFVGRMNKRAAELGLQNTKFANCTGLPAPDSYSTAHDVAVMFKELAKHKIFFEYSKVWMYDLAHPSGRVTGLTNTNKLVRFFNGCDGGKTGFTKEALSCLALTAKRGDTRLVGVIIAAPDAKARNAEVSKLMNFGFAGFETKKIIAEDTVIENKAAVDGGIEEQVGVRPAKAFSRLVKKGESPEFKYEVVVNNLKAPIREGDVAGKVIILSGGEALAEIDLLAAASVRKLTYLDLVNRMIDKW